MKVNYIISFLLAVLLLFNIQVFARQITPLDFVVKPYILEVTDRSFQVFWETSIAVKGEIRLAKSEFDILRPEMIVSVADDTPQFYHSLTVEGLVKSDLYLYQVVNITEYGDTLKSSITPITIPDYHQSAISFSVVGDTQGNPVVWKRIAELMSEETPQFIVHVGDLVQYGPHKDDWTDEFFKPASDLLSYTPLYPAIGNHEMNDEKLYQYFNLPFDNAFYSVKKGDLIMIFVDTNKDVLPGSEQYRKLEYLLASSHETWKIVVHHHPLFTSDKFSYRSSMMSTPIKGDPNILHLKSLYEIYGVDLTLAGHVHNYERTWPIMKNHIDEENGVTHIVSGGGGGGFRKVPNDRNWFSVEAKNINHFLNIRIWKNKLLVEAIDTSGIVFDFWEKEKKYEHSTLNAPLITSPRKYFIDSTVVNIENANKTGNINYRLNDGLYKAADSDIETLVVNKTTTVSAIVSDVNNESREIVKTMIKLPLFPKQKSSTKKVKAEYYEGHFTVLPGFDSLKPTNSFVINLLSLMEIQPRKKDHFAVRFKGSFSVPKTDVYRFFLESFDGSKLIIDGVEIINNDGVHYEIFTENYVALEKGSHNIEVQYFDYKRRETLNLLIGNEKGEMGDINKFIDLKRKGN